jgi:hypothetical protein
VSALYFFAGYIAGGIATLAAMYLGFRANERREQV